MSIPYGMLCDCLSQRRRGPGYRAFLKRVATRRVRRMVMVEVITSSDGHVAAFELPLVPPRPDWKPFIMEGEVEELPLAPHLQDTTAEDEEPSDAVMFFVEETSLVNARRDEESYWTGAVDVDEQLWLTNVLSNPDSIYAPSQSRGYKDPTESRFEWGMPAEAKERVRDRKAKEAAAQRREYDERQRRRWQRY